MDTARAQLERDTIAAFRDRFGTFPTVIAAAPGRVNLIGEHTDYNDGFVLPAAIDRAIAVAARPRGDRRLRLYSANFAQASSVDLEAPLPPRPQQWVKYVAGVAALLSSTGVRLAGADMCINGDIPRGAGLSSSAALEMAVASAFERLNNLSLSDTEIIRLCQRAEHEFVGVQCGIMDQFVSRLGRAGHALLIDCRSLAFEHVPVPDAVRLVILDTGVKRALASSAYNQRRQECSEGVRGLSAVMPGITALRDVSPVEFARHADLLPPDIRKRSRHVVTENERVLQAVEALRQGELAVVGKLMYDSHLSLERDYEVSCLELDAMVDICAECEGVYGARMTGAGFGGCAICIAGTEAVDEIARRVQREYPVKTGKTPTVLVTSPAGGATARPL